MMFSPVRWHEGGGCGDAAGALASGEYEKWMDRLSGASAPVPDRRRVAACGPRPAGWADAAAARDGRGSRRSLRWRSRTGRAFRPCSLPERDERLQAPLAADELIGLAVGAARHGDGVFEADLRYAVHEFLERDTIAFSGIADYDPVDRDPLDGRGTVRVYHGASFEIPLRRDRARNPSRSS